MENYSGAYIIQRQRKGGGRKPPNGRRHGAAALIVLLLLLTAGIIFLVIILPRLPSGSSVTSAEYTFYLLAVDSTDDYLDAAIKVKDATSRGGGGYVYNDGKYNIIAAAYTREAEAKAIAEINEGSYYITLDIPKTTNASDANIVKYICGEFFSELTDVATSVDRGTLTDAAADLIVYDKMMKLSVMIDSGASAELAFALDGCRSYEAGGGSRSQLSYIRYVTVQALVGAYNGLSAGA